MSNLRLPLVESLPSTAQVSQPSEKSIDSQINSTDALNYWNSIDADVNGMLGGFPQVSRIDLQGSSNFLTKLRRRQRPQTSSQVATQQSQLLGRAVDCGAGIGRITRGFLLHVAEVVDIVEPVEKFTAELVKAVETPPKQKQGGSFHQHDDDCEPQNMAARRCAAQKPIGCVGTIYNLPLEQWQPQRQTYNLIWTQWCSGQLTDIQMVDYLRRCTEALISPSESDGQKVDRGMQLDMARSWIIIKENMSTNPDGDDIYDPEDNSVTRTDAKYRDLFAQAGLRVVAHEIQRGLPRDLYPVRMYALQPIEWIKKHELRTK